MLITVPQMREELYSMIPAGDAFLDEKNSRKTLKTRRVKHMLGRAVRVTCVCFPASPT